MKQKVIALLLLGLLIIGGGWLLLRNQTKQPETTQLQVTTSFYPYYFFTSQIGGTKTNVTNITPAGGEPHDYEPTSQDLVTIESSKLLVLNGNVEPWATKIKESLKNKTTLILEAGSGLFTQQVLDENGVNATDPHIWLSPRLAKIQVTSILTSLVHIDPANTAYYTANATKLTTSLDTLDQAYKTGLATCRLKDIITSHAAFGYLATDYGLKQVPIAGLSPDAEPSLKQLTDVANFAKANHVNYIFFESLVSPKLSQTIASEVGAQTLVLNPIEGLTPDDLAHGKTYLTVMYDNLHNLRLALDCQ